MTTDELYALMLGKLAAIESGGSGSGSGSGGESTGGMTPEETEAFNNLMSQMNALAVVAYNTLRNNPMFAAYVTPELTASNAFQTYMTAISATLKALDTSKINAEYINVENLKAVVTAIQKANIGTLFADYIKTNDLVATGITVDALLGASAQFLTAITTSLSSEDVAAFRISSNNVTFENASIKNAAIESVSASKVTAGTINTSQVAIKSGDQTSMVISDGLIKIQDSQYVRVQIGRIEPNVYDMRVWDTSGALMWSASGITAAAIKSAIIVDDMVAPNANISANKINIASLVTAINETGNVTTKASNITLDAEGQKLDSWFSTMESWKSSQSSATSQLQTQFTQINGQISTFVSKSDLAIIEGEMQSINEQYTKLNQTVSGISTTISSHTQKINNLESTVDGMEKSVTDAANTVATYETRLTELSATANGLTSTVSTVSNNVSNLQSTVDGFSNKSFVNNDTFTQALTEFKQAQDSITLAVTQSILDSNNSVLSNVSKWFTFNSEGLIIGSNNNNIKLKMSNDVIEFVNTVNGEEHRLGRWDGNSFTTKNIVVEDSMSLNFGGYEILKDANGNLVIRGTDE